MHVRVAQLASPLAAHSESACVKYQELLGVCCRHDDGTAAPCMHRCMQGEKTNRMIISTCTGAEHLHAVDLTC